jgi:hypothetical protein
MESEAPSTTSARFVRIPFGTRIRYPAECPFTAWKNPRSAVRIERREMQMFLPIPFVGMFKLGKVGRTIFPASGPIAIVTRFLRVLPLLFVIAGVVSLKWIGDKPFGWLAPVLGFALMYVCFVAEWLWLHRVRIIRIGMSSLEVRFASQKYAEEFCRLNDLHSHSKPTRKRPVPITVNDIR